MSHWDCLAHHDAETCFLPISSYRMILLGDVEEFRRKLNSLCFTHQHVDCLNRFFKYRFNGNFLVESGQVFDNVQIVACLNRKNSGMDRIRSIAWEKTKRLRKRYKKRILSSFQKTELTQTSESFIAERIEQAEMTKHEQEWIKLVDSFLNSYGSYSSNIVNFEINPYKLTSFCNPTSLTKMK